VILEIETFGNVTDGSNQASGNTMARSPAVAVGH
jgi:hypothetical protein